VSRLREGTDWLGSWVMLRLAIDVEATNGLDIEVIELTVKATFKQLGLALE